MKYLNNSLHSMTYFVWYTRAIYTESDKLLSTTKTLLNVINAKI